MRKKISDDQPVLDFIREHPELTDRQVGDAFGLKHYDIVNLRNRHHLQREPFQTPTPKPIAELVSEDLKAALSEHHAHSVEDKYEHALKRIQAMETERDAIFKLKDVTDSLIIKPVYKAAHSEATAVALLSDNHIEERVRPSEVNGLNEHTIDIAEKRMRTYFVNLVRLLKMNQQNVSIKNLVLALLGDHISGNIHEELLETAELQPTEALVEVFKWIDAGIAYVLQNTAVNLILVCRPGNHSRITKKTRNATEDGNSLEYIMFQMLAVKWASEPRIQFVIANGYHTYLDIYGINNRFHHGHSISYGGGVGGIYIPVNKAINEWNKARKADFDWFGHFHQLIFGTNFICNGSSIGYNSFALRIKATYEKPRQAFALIDKNRGRTMMTPILVDQS